MSILLFLASFLIIFSSPAYAGIDWPNLNATSLSSVPPSEFASISVSQLQSIPPAACAGFLIAQLKAMDSFYNGCSGFTSSCVSNIPGAVFGGFQNKCVGNLGKEVILTITSQQLSYLSDSTVSGFTRSQLSYMTNSCSGFRSSQLKNINADYSFVFC